MHGLGNADARALLSSAVRFKLDERIRDRIIEEMRGNPLALLELPRGLTATQLAGGFGLPEAQALTGRIQESFVRRVSAVSDDARLLLLLAAAEPVGDPLLLLRASEQLGIAVSAVDAETDGLLALGQRVTFRHPLVRSAVYGTATGARTPGGTSGVGGGDRPGVSIPIAGHGIWLRPRRDLMSRSPRSSSARPVGRRRGVEPPPRQRSCSAPSR